MRKKMRWAFIGCVMATGFSTAHGQDAAGTNDVRLQPGMWESTVAITEMQAPGLSEEQVLELRRQVPPRTASQCITAAQAIDPLDSLARQGSCSLTRRVFSGGTIDAAGTCRQPNQPELELVMTGTYTAEAISAEFRTESANWRNATSPSQMTRMRLTYTARRTGHCPTAP